MTRRVAGSETNFQLIIIYFYFFPGVQINQWPFITVKRQLPHLPGGRSKIKHWLFFFVQMQRQVPCIIDKFIAKYMIEVTMSVKQQNRRQACFFEERF